MQSVVDIGKYTAKVAQVIGCNTLGHKLRFPQVKKAQFVTVMGINGINDRYTVVGVQPYEVFKRALAQMLKEKDG
jgi:hypothetical protein